MIPVFVYAKQLSIANFGETPSTQAKESSGEKPVFNLQRPSAIKAFLDQHVIGQEHAKVLSVAVHNHYKRL